MARKEEDPLSFGKKPSIGSRILDILSGAAKGYGEGAGGAAIPEASFARSFSSAYDTGKAGREKQDTLNALESFRSTPDYAGLTETEKTAFRADPIGFLKERSSRRPDKDSMLDEATTAEIYKALGREAPPGTRISKAAGERLTAIVGLRDRKVLAAQAAEDRKAVAAERQAGITERNMDEQVRKFEKRIDDLGIPSAITTFVPLAKLIKPEGDAPGFGPGESAVPGLLNQFLNPEGQKARQLVQSISNIKIKDRSGATVTPPEFDRFLTEFGSGIFKTEAQLRTGLQQALNTYRSRLQNAIGGVGADVRGRFYKNAGVDDYLQTLGAINFEDSNGTATKNKADDFSDLQSQGLFK